MTAPVQQITGDLSESLFTGGGSVPEVPDKWQVAIGGRPYMLDTKMTEAWRHKGVPLLRQQQDNQTTPSGASLSSEGTWRAGVDSWHKGAGQSYRDRPDSNAFRFNTSKGIDPWIRYQIGLLPDTDQKKSSANTNLHMCTAGSRLYVTDGATLSYTTDATADSPTWTAVTGGTPGTLTSICSDGFYVWVCDGSDIYQTNTGVSTGFGTAWSTDNATLVRVAKGRLFAVDGNTINTYTAAASGSALTVGWTTPNAFTWVDIVDSPSTKHVFAAGYVGDKSIVFAFGLKDDATGLDAGVVAAELPDGEIVRSLGSYLGFLLIGTDKGVRFAVPGSTGALTVGVLLETGAPAECFEGQGSDVWFGWKNYDATSTGLGRLSLQEFTATDNLAPAYASDLMATAQGSVQSVVTFGGRRYFTVSGSGVWGEEVTPVASGTVTAGRITANVAEQKTVFGVDVRHQSIDGGSTTVALSTDGGTYSTLGAALTADGTVPAESVGREFDVELTLTADGSDYPVVSSWTMRYYPRVKRQTIHTLPLLLHRQVELVGGTNGYVNVSLEREALTAFYRNGTVVTLQQASGSVKTVVDDFEWIPHHFEETAGDEAQGTMVVTLKEVA